MACFKKTILKEIQILIDFKGFNTFVKVSVISVDKIYH